ncbi:MAG TPA: hypothetical protein P5128_10765 [Candidatus Sumerlaeia bacterium]|nr:hypothetical protein [Candidatus Sumerlaeia bacterium]
MTDNPILRVGVQNCLSALPLTAKLKEIEPGLEINDRTPRELSNLLVKGELDVALIPMLTVLRNPQISILPNISVTCRGASYNSIMFSKTAPADIKTVLVDRRSIISIALLRALFNIRWSMQPVEVLSSKPITSDYPFLTTDYDAFLVVGDAAMQIKEEFNSRVDLGEQWYAWTSESFTFSVWGVREGLEGPALDELFLQAKEEGLAAKDEIIQAESSRLRVHEEKCREILGNTIYNLGTEEMKGIEWFHFFMDELKICEPSVELKIYGGDKFQILMLGKK